MNDVSEANPASLLEFWFGPARRDPGRIPERMGMWFSPGAEEDDAVRARFEPVVEAAAGGHLTDWLVHAEGRLALVLTLDQGPRVIYRRQAEAFAHDGRALALALAGLDAGVDLDLGLAERAFFCMPLQHAEDRLVQERSVKAYERLRDDFPAHREIGEGFVQHAREHAEIVERFGRFPHRNRVLGRRTTPAERQFLKSGPRYGQ